MYRFELLTTNEFISDVYTYVSLKNIMWKVNVTTVEQLFLITNTFFFINKIQIDATDSEKSLRKGFKLVLIKKG